MSFLTRLRKRYETKKETKESITPPPIVNNSKKFIDRLQPLLTVKCYNRCYQPRHHKMLTMPVDHNNISKSIVSLNTYINTVKDDKCIYLVLPFPTIEVSLTSWLMDNNNCFIDPDVYIPKVIESLIEITEVVVMKNSVKDVSSNHRQNMVILTALINCYSPMVEALKDITDDHHV